MQMTKKCVQHLITGVENMEDASKLLQCFFDKCVSGHNPGSMNPGSKQFFRKTVEDLNKARCSCYLVI